MSEYYEKQLYGKYQLTMELPETFRELLWRIGYFRRNESSWRLLVKSFKPSTTNFSTDEQIKTNTITALNSLVAFYESASTLDPVPMGTTAAPKFTLYKAPFWTSENVDLGEVGLSTVQNPKVYKHPVYNHMAGSSEGLQTAIDNTAIKAGAVHEGAALSKQDALRIQSSDPFVASNLPAAENISQDVEKMVEMAKMVFNSYGIPYTTVRGEDCSRWLFSSRNTALKAVALMAQECPWLIQAINNFNFFNAQIIEQLTAIKQAATATQLYGHLESADNEAVDSPRHLLVPLWSDQANIEDKSLSSLLKKGTFELKYWNASGNGSSSQDLLPLYCHDTYEPNAFTTNNPFQD